MSSKKISLPTPKASKKSKVIVVGLLVLGLYFVITDPAGSSENVNGFLDSLATFGTNLGVGR